MGQACLSKLGQTLFGGEVIEVDSRNSISIDEMRKSIVIKKNEKFLDNYIIGHSMGSSS
jgi:hypothetical protein